MVYRCVSFSAVLLDCSLFSVDRRCAPPGLKERFLGGLVLCVAATSFSGHSSSVDGRISASNQVLDDSYEPF